MTSQGSAFTPSQLARPGEDPAYVEDAIAYDNYKIKEAEFKRDVDDEDFDLSKDNDEDTDYDPSASQETQASQSVRRRRSGSRRQRTRHESPAGEDGDDDDDNDNDNDNDNDDDDDDDNDDDGDDDDADANGDRAATASPMVWEDEPSSQPSQSQENIIANGKLDGEKLCRIAQVYKEWRATGKDEAFQYIPPQWRWIVQVLYGLTEEELKATILFCHANLKTLFRTPHFEPKHWAKAEEEAGRTWHIYLEKVRN
ncbi:hypothetical protein FKP32DRAFT_1590156 [Trametes sanguinea]|nr:hypothetical protein FKP32DRAFT_1590156 [Trametes sanguinea]